MPDPIPATEVRRRFRSVLRRIAAGERVVVASHGKAVAAVVSVADVEMLDALERFVAGRELRPDSEPEDWSPIFGDIQPFEL